MKTKREVLKHFAKYGSCENIKCTDCPYYNHSKLCPNDSFSLKRIGAMAILRMFKEKKKPILDVGTKIKFSDKKIAVVDTYNKREYFLIIEGSKISLDYLIGRTWEIVE